jgi:hypothetical protein
MDTPVTDEEFTELRDADIPRVDLVDKAANGMTFLIAKREDGAGLMDPGLIRDLIGKSEPAPRPEETVTMSGSPAAIFKLIHEAAVAKAKYDADDLKRMAASGAAMENESYPIEDREDLDRAIHAVGRGGSSHDAIRAHIIRRARSLGASSEIPDNWNKDGSLKGDVAKEMDMDDDALDPTVMLAEADGDAPGMDTDPGSPAWEAVDAATARKWTSILARAKAAIDMLADRELMEAASADPDDAENAWDLQDACCAIDYAISVLAPFAVAEQAEADCCDDMQMVGKAMAGFDSDALGTIEALGQVRKAGRVLSTANEQAIRGAVESLQKVLASLPQAPTTDDEVAKTANEEPNMDKPTLSEDVTAAAGQEPAMGVQEADPKPVAGQPVTDMAKADGDKPEMVAVFNANGKLVGIVDPSKITPVSGADADTGADDTTDDPADAAAPQTPDLTPEPPAEAGTPADAVPTDDDAVTKNTDTPSEDVLKSTVEATVAAALAQYQATQEQTVAKQADDRAQLAEQVAMLKAKVEALEEQPAMPKVFTNGAIPRDVRGMDNGSAATPVGHELKKSLMASTDAGEQREIALRMQEQARAAFDRLQQG